MKNKNQISMFETTDLPLFSGTAQNARQDVFQPETTEYQDTFFKCKHCKDTGFLGTVYKRSCPFCEKGLYKSCDPNVNSK